jgi:hypothetical protein
MGKQTPKIHTYIVQKINENYKYVNELNGYIN